MTRERQIVFGPEDIWAVRGRHRNEERGREAVVDLSDKRCELSRTGPFYDVAWCHGGYDSGEADLLDAVFHVRDPYQPPGASCCSSWTTAGPRHAWIRQQGIKGLSTLRPQHGETVIGQWVFAAVHFSRCKTVLRCVKLDLPAGHLRQAED
ncbi:MAG: hypothetical protein OXH83_06425, partial [Bryobacterales bacterium]|nr:hypothetical protein [Bryobacterales bacterium]